jgi:hypothetical protein
MVPLDRSIKGRKGVRYLFSLNGLGIANVAAPSHSYDLNSPSAEGWGMQPLPHAPSVARRGRGNKGDGRRSTQGSRVFVKTSDCSGGLRPPALRINTFGAHRAPLQRKKAGFHTDSHAVG